VHYSAVALGAWARLWIVDSAQATPSSDELELLRRARPRAMLHAAEAHEGAQRWRACVDASMLVHCLESFDDSALRAWSETYGGAVVLVVVPRPAIESMLHLALLDGAASKPRLDRARSCVIDWPPTSDRSGRPALIGVDLDWLPPPPPTHRARFPGGPGSAPSARG
jgi:hypothetical protein